MRKKLLTIACLITLSGCAKNGVSDSTTTYDQASEEHTTLTPTTQIHTTEVESTEIQSTEIQPTEIQPTEKQTEEGC